MRERMVNLNVTVTSTSGAADARSVCMRDMIIVLNILHMKQHMVWLQRVCGPQPSPLLLSLRRGGGRAAGHGHQVDAVPVAAAVGQVMAQVGAVDADALAVGQAAHVLPVHLIVPEARPPMRPALLHKRRPGSAAWRLEQQLAGDRVVKVLARLVGLGQEPRLGPVPRVLRVVAVEAADAVSRLGVTAPPQLFLQRSDTGAVCLLVHDGIRARHGELGALGDRRQRPGLRLPRRSVVLGLVRRHGSAYGDRRR